MAIAAAAVFLFVIGGATHPASAQALDPHPDSPFQIVALGDSYISGEGAEQYFPGTDEPGEPGRNLCHRAATAHPYLVADELDASLRFIACSGARTGDVTGLDAAGNPAPGQYPGSGEGIFGAHSQVSVLRNLTDPDAVLISIGGNDAGFREIGTTCVLRNCQGSFEFWLRRLDERIRPALVKTYDMVREAARGAPVFAFTYPIPLGPRFCDDLLGVGPAEMAFLRDVFIVRLNQTVKSAAAQAGVGVIDTSGALAGYRFCEREPGGTAINFVKLGRTSGGRIDLRALPRGSLHPSPLGHGMLAPLALAKLRALRAAAQ